MSCIKQPGDSDISTLGHSPRPCSMLLWVRQHCKSATPLGYRSYLSRPRAGFAAAGRSTSCSQLPAYFSQVWRHPNDVDGASVTVVSAFLVPQCGLLVFCALEHHRIRQISNYQRLKLYRNYSVDPGSKPRLARQSYLRCLVRAFRSRRSGQRVVAGDH